MTDTDRIEKRVTLQAPVSRVWQAIADSGEFGAWFGVILEGPFVAGAAIRGTFNLELDEASLMERQRSLGLRPSGLRLPVANSTFCTVERIEPERYFSFRWIPYGIDAEADPDEEPTTLVEFLLEPVAEGTRLTIVESGFDAVPAHRRQRAYRMNQGGWEAQASNLTNHVQGA